jgi:hypothetical protein
MGSGRLQPRGEELGRLQEWKRGRERGGGQRGGGVRGRGRLGLGGKLMGSPPPDRDPRPKLALTSAPDPSTQVQQVFYCFTSECFLKNSNPNYTDHERKRKNKFKFFSENWVSQREREEREGKGRERKERERERERGESSGKHVFLASNWFTSENLILEMHYDPNATYFMLGFHVRRNNISESSA